MDQQQYYLYKVFGQRKCKSIDQQMGVSSRRTAKIPFEYVHNFAYEFQEFARNFPAVILPQLIHLQ